MDTDAAAALDPEVRAVIRQRLSSEQEDVYAVVNQKGGAGKTTTTITLAAVWASWGLRVRIIDGDPQLGSATYWLPPEWGDRTPQDLRAVFFDESSLDEATAATSVPGVWIVPSDKTLGQVEYAQLADPNLQIREALRESKEHFHVTLYDCRPSLGVLTVAGLAAAQKLIIPLGASGMDVPGLMELNDTLDIVRRRLNPGVPVSAVVVCHDSDTILSRDVRARLDEDYPASIRWRIRRSVRVEEAPFEHEPLTTFAPELPATKDYAGLAGALLKAAA